MKQQPFITSVFVVFAFTLNLLLFSGITFAATERVSVSSDGVEGDGYSYQPSISADGRFVAFESYSGNIIPVNTYDKKNIYVHDRQTGEASLISVNSDGVIGREGSANPSISADGRFVAFDSDASNLVPDDSNGSRDVFVHDRQTGETSLISVNSNGVQGNGNSGDPSISADGRFVAFSSRASNLVLDDTNERYQIFVHDRQTGETFLISVNSDGVPGDHDSSDPSISADGRLVAFTSEATNFSSADTNLWFVGDVFVHDRQTGETSMVSVSSDGVQGDDAHGEPKTNGSWYPSISADGRFVAFYALASNLVPDDTDDNCDVFVRDLQTGETSLVSRSSDGIKGNDDSSGPSISADGRFVAFSSEASNLVPDDTNNGSGIFVNGRDIFVHDRQTGETSLVSVSSDGVQGSGDSRASSISADGRFVAFSSEASDLVPDDTNGRSDIFVAECADKECAYNLMMSTNPDRSDATYLDGQDADADENIYVFISPTANVKWVKFSIDGKKQWLDREAPFDLGKNSTVSRANPYNTNVLDNGYHTFTAKIKKDDGDTETISAQLYVGSNESDDGNDPDDGSDSEPTQWISYSADRSNPIALDGATISGSVYVFVSPATDVKWVKFSIDGKKQWLDREAPFDLGKNSTVSQASPYNTNVLDNGYHTFTAKMKKYNGDTETISAQLYVGSNESDDGSDPDDGSDSEPSQWISYSANRSNPIALDGATISGSVYVFVSPATDVKWVKFSIDGKKQWLDREAPFDLGSNSTVSQASPFNVNALSDGYHTFTAKMKKDNGDTETISAKVRVSN